MCIQVIKSPPKLTGAPGIAEEDEFPEHASPPLVVFRHEQLKSVAGHRGRGWRGDEDGGSVEVQVLWFEVSLPAGGGNPLGEGDRH